ncbi:MAG: HEPN domain-containing protein [Spirochaetes bacterium]|nr:HEPN domain-containing protein [Spirochaetota bacterium]
MNDTAIYHTQQCAEKSLKSFLAFKNYEIVKSHDLIKILEIIIKIDDSFKVLEENLEELNPYSVIFRYPDDEYIEPEKSDVKRTVLLAENIYNFVNEKLNN